MSFNLVPRRKYYKTWINCQNQGYYSGDRVPPWAAVYGGWSRWTLERFSKLVNENQQNYNIEPFFILDNFKENIANFPKFYRGIRENLAKNLQNLIGWKVYGIRKAGPEGSEFIKI